MEPTMGQDLSKNAIRDPAAQHVLIEDGSTPFYFNFPDLVLFDALRYCTLSDTSKRCSSPIEHI
jgi:hypothetical protein